MNAIRTLLACILAAPALAGGGRWFPAEDWRETPDECASPRAKKGGTLRFNGSSAPKSLNAYVDNNAYTMMTFELMYSGLVGVDARTLDFVPDLASRWHVSDDGAVFTFEMNPRAKWSDGVPVTAEDVKWTFDTVMSEKSETGPWKVQLGYFESPVVEPGGRIRFSKKPGSAPDWRDLMNCGRFPVLPRHALEGRDFNKASFLGMPVSGPYRLSRVAEQIETEFSRVEGWWCADSPSCMGLFNFDRIVMRYYVDNENAFEALKKRAIDVYPVYSARIMAEGTRAEKFARNWMLKRRVANQKPTGFQGFAMNMRRSPFDDVRVRKAMAHLVDRETMNRTMMSGEYFLLRSYYSDLYDDARPCGNELVRYDPSAARALLEEAGWRRRPEDGKLWKDGRRFVFTFLSRGASEDKFLSMFSHALEECGIEMKIDRKDFAGWMRDMDEFNFDMTWASWGSSIFKSPEFMWLSSEADRKGSNNITGFKSAEVDAIIKAEKSMLRMKDREDAYRRIDALVAEQVPYVLLWQVRETRLLYWNKFGMPDSVLTRHGDESCVLSCWWYDEDRAEELERAMSAGRCLPGVPERASFVPGGAR